MKSGTASGGLGRKSVLSNIANIAAKGVSLLSVTSTAEHLLGLTVQPSLTTQQQHVDTLVLKSPLNQMISEELVPTMIVLDLASSGSRAWESANVLLDLALKRLPSHFKSGIIGSGGSSDVKKEHLAMGGVYDCGASHNSNGANMKAITGVLQNLSSLVILSSNKPTSDITGGLSPKGINKCLNTAVVPLDADANKTFLSCYKEMHLALNKVELALDESVVKRSDQNKRPIVRIAFKHLAALFEKSSYSNGLMKYICR